MRERNERPLKTSEQELSNEVAKKATRRQRSIEQGEWSVWFGLGMFGIIGWSVAIPTVLGVAAGLWLDRHWPLGFSWTLTLLLTGLLVGCINAWYWLSRQNEALSGKARNDEEDGTRGR